jgi:hypothetical protein
MPEARNPKHPNPKQTLMTKGSKSQNQLPDFCQSESRTVLTFRFLNFEIVLDLGSLKLEFLASLTDPVRNAG